MYKDIEMLKRSDREVIVRITEVNASKMIIWALGAKNTQYQASFAGLDPLVAIPETNEYWILKGSSDFSWRLYKRLENGNEQVSIDSLKEGDRRLEANGLFLSTKRGTIMRGQLTLVDMEEPLTRLEGITLASVDGELVIVKPDGTWWKFALEQIDPPLDSAETPT